MTECIHTKLGGGRRIAIPADLCQRYHLHPGDAIVLEAMEGGIVIRPLSDVIQEVQSFFAEVAPSGVRLSEELLRDRRAEASKESND